MQTLIYTDQLRTANIFLKVHYIVLVAHEEMHAAIPSRSILPDTSLLSFSRAGGPHLHHMRPTRPPQPLGRPQL